MKRILKSLVPAGIITFGKRLFFRNKAIDPVDERYAQQNIDKIFSEVYEVDEWGKGDESKYKQGNARFYSGSGSYNAASSKYIEFITRFIGQKNIKSVTDLGCGDFNIGRQICDLNPEIVYHGVDVVQNLIEFNNKMHGNDRIKFYCINTLVDEVPVSDLLLIRQVFQHLSNDDILKVTNNVFGRFNNILVTEHQPKKQYLVKPNIDKNSGPNTRLGFGSGVYLNKPPFNYKWTCVLSVEDNDNKSYEISTYEINK